MDGTQAAFMVVREKLSLVGGQVDGDGAIALATFAGETEVEGLLDFLTPPAVADDFALGHLPEQVRAAAGGVLFFAGHAEAGTHHPTFVVAALPHSDAAQGGMREAAMVMGKLEMGGRLPGEGSRPCGRARRACRGSSSIRDPRRT